MGFLWCLVTPTDEDREKPNGSIYTWGDYAEKIFATILSRHPKANQIVFVNEPYELEFMTKNSEHDRRQSSQAYSHNTKKLYMKSKAKFSPTRDFGNMFSNKTNKHRLQRFLRGI